MLILILYVRPPLPHYQLYIFAALHSTSLKLTSCAHIAMTTKTASNANKPAKSTHSSSFSASTPSRKIYKNVVSSTAKKGYRSDLRAEAVARASAVKQSQRETGKGPQKTRELKLRGAKARKAAEAGDT